MYVYIRILCACTHFYDLLSMMYIGISVLDSVLSFTSSFLVINCYKDIRRYAFIKEFIYKNEFFFFLLVEIHLPELFSAAVNIKVKSKASCSV